MQQLLPAWPGLRRKIQRAGQIVLFLDYDGTLTPIVSHPSKARLPAETRRLLLSLSRQRGIWIALVSGRALKEIRRLVGLKGLCYVGNHGLELAGPKIRHVNPMARKSRPVLKRIAVSLRTELKKIPGAWVEDKGLTLAVHYRQVNPRKKLLVRSLFHEVVRPYGKKRQVRITEGKEVFEVRPPVRWTKGTAVTWLLARRRTLSRGPVLPVVIGDDLTDEDAFKALGNRGITVAVGPSNPRTRARYGVASHLQVLSFLRRLLEVWKEKTVG